MNEVIDREVALAPYQTIQGRWDKFAVIRTRPRRILADYDIKNDIFYPPERQPLIVHPLVISKGTEVINAILLHTAYKFMLDISEVEVNNIVRLSLNIYNDEYGMDFPKAMREDVLTIIIDEAHHAYIAFDYVTQLEEYTGIKKVAYQDEVELGYYLKKYQEKLGSKLAKIFELIAIAIGENTLTKELFQMKRNTEIHPFFSDVISDHMFDEGRHSKFFRWVLTYVWQRLSADEKVSILKVLPYFIIDYTGNELNKVSSQKILATTGFSQSEIEQIITETYQEDITRDLVKRNPVAANIVSVLKSTGVILNSDAQTIFQEAGIEL